MINKYIYINIIYFLVLHIQYMRQTYQDFILKYYKLQELDPDIPPEIRITTLTTLFTFPVIFNTKYIADNINLSNDFINTVKYGNSTVVHKTLNVLNNKAKKRKSSKVKIKKRKNFYFQTTLIIKNDDINLNIKIFRNGCIQVTGAKNISTIFWCLYKIFKLFSSEDNDNYAQPCELANIKCIQSFKIVTINCVFNIGFKLNRTLLYTRLNNDGYNCSYDSSRHPGINLKFTDLDNTDERNISKYKKRQVSIVIFEKGNIMLSGTINYKDIIICYKFLNEYLITNYDEIVKIYE